MPPVFGPVSPSPMRLKSWAATSGTTAEPSVRQNSETSGPSRYSSITTRPHATAWASAAARSEVTTTPLPAARPSSFTTYGGAELVERRRRLRRVDAHPRRCGGHPGRAHHVLGERLAAFELRCLARRSEAVDAGRAHRVGDARDERRLRADDHQVGGDVGSEGGHRGTVHGVDAALLGHGGGARVSRRADQRRHRRIGRERQAQGVLARSGTDDKDAHERRAYGPPHV